MSLGTLWGAVLSGTFMASVSLVAILHVGEVRISTPARQFFSTYISSTDQQQDLVQCVILDISNEVSCW